MIKFDEAELIQLREMLSNYTISEIYSGADVLQKCDLNGEMYAQYRKLANEEIKSRVKKGQLLMATAV